MTVRFSGLFNDSELAQWKGRVKGSIRKSVKKGLEDAAKEIVPFISLDIKANFKVKTKGRGKGFEKAINKHVYDNDKDRMPAMLLNHKASFMQAHQEGASITGRKGYVIIPIIKERIPYAIFQNLLSTLKSNGKLFYLKRGSKTIVMAETYKGSPNILRKFNRHYKASIGTTKATKAGTLIPIGVLKRKVILRKRLHFTEIVKENIGYVKKNIIKHFELNKI